MKKLISVLEQICEELHSIRKVMEFDAISKGYNEKDPVARARGLLKRSDELRK